MTRNQYIFIDCENVGESDLSRVTDKSVRVFMILGARQKTLPTAHFIFNQDHPGQLRIVQTPVEGRNALDFVLTLELGRLITSDPEGYFHIVSKDTDFDSIIRHLKGEKKHIARHISLADIPALRTPEERLARIQADLEDPNKSRPACRKDLENKIKSSFDNKADPKFVDKAIKSWTEIGLFDFTENDKVLYKDKAA